MTESRQKRKDPLAWGLILIIIGALFFLHNIDIDVWDIFARLWPLVLVAWGVWKVYFGIMEKKKQAEPKKD